MAFILIVDDERAITDLLSKVLSTTGHTVRAINDSRQVLRLDLNKYDLIVLDIMMPGVDGLTLLTTFRSQVDAPIVLLTAKTAEHDVVQGLKTGADDYIKKPFSNAELRAKIDAHLRREKLTSLAFGHSSGSIRLALESRQLYVDEKPMKLTRTEFDISEFLAEQPGWVFTREQILEAVGEIYEPRALHTVAMHISNLRSKLKAAGVEPIKTVWGGGYKWEW